MYTASGIRAGSYTGGGGGGGAVGGGEVGRGRGGWATAGYWTLGLEVYVHYFKDDRQTERSMFLIVY
jgi:hypothetical protein